MAYDVKPIVSPKHADCGPTCLKMLLTYYDKAKDVDLATLSKECNVNIKRGGCTFADLKRVGNAHGLDVLCYGDCEDGTPGAIPWDGVTKQDRPSIVWWKKYHFVVCCGIDDQGKVVICDPDAGRIRFAPDTFESYYSEKALFNGEPHDLPKKEGAES